MQLTLSAHPPFSLLTVIRSHGWIRLAPFVEDGTNGALIYITQLNSGRVVEMRVHEAPGGVSVDVDASLSQAEADDLTRQVAWMLGLEQDFSAGSLRLYPSRLLGTQAGVPRVVPRRSRWPRRGGGCL